MLLTFLTVTSSVSAQQSSGDRRRGVAGSSIRTPGGQSGLEGFWTNGTATPLERPAELAERFSLTEAEALEYEKFGLARLLKQLPESEIVTSGDLNDAYLDTSSLKLAGERRTSLIVDPPNGKLPAKVTEEQKPSGESAKRS